MSHTIGPWEVSKQGNRLRIWAHRHIRFGIAEILENRSITDNGPSSREKADAQLIAMAPDLLALARDVAKHFEGTDAPLGKRARKIIERATS